MSIDRSAFRKPAAVRSRAARPSQPRQSQTSAEMKARQSAKIRELKQSFIAAGIATLDEQAKALGLSRSTTWTILKGNHKASGLSATTINRILAARQLPPLVRTTVLEYVAEKAAGCYGHSESGRRRFIDRLSIKVEQKMAAMPDPRIGQASSPASDSYRRSRRLARRSARFAVARKLKQERLRRP